MGATDEGQCEGPTRDRSGTEQGHREGQRGGGTTGGIE